MKSKNTGISTFILNRQKWFITTIKLNKTAMHIIRPLKFLFRSDVNPINHSLKAIQTNSDIKIMLSLWCVVILRNY